MVVDASAKLVGPSVVVVVGPSLDEATLLSELAALGAPSSELVHVDVKSLPVLVIVVRPFTGLALLGPLVMVERKVSRLLTVEVIAGGSLVTVDMIVWRLLAVDVIGAGVLTKVEMFVLRLLIVEVLGAGSLVMVERTMLDSVTTIVVIPVVVVTVIVGPITVDTRGDVTVEVIVTREVTTEWPGPLVLAGFGREDGPAGIIASREVCAVDVSGSDTKAGTVVGEEGTGDVVEFERHGSGIEGGVETRVAAAVEPSGIPVMVALTVGVATVTPVPGDACQYLLSSLGKLY